MGGNIPELITRAVVIVDNLLLCVHRKSALNIFLPGGHIEPGESARESLVRELREELGTDCSAGEFLSTVEHTFPVDGKPLFEINLLFLVESHDLSPLGDTASAEDHLEFMWLSCEENILKEKNLQPWILQKYLPAFSETGTMPSFLTTAAER